MELMLEHKDLVAVGISILAGSLVGLEREYRNKSAGFRTIVLICLGATVFTIVSRFGRGSDDRIAANIITGIGFIGAGVIFKDKFSVMGLTTAAVIWIVAGIGMAAGMGYYHFALAIAVITVVVLSVFSRVEVIMRKLLLTRTLFVVFQGNGMHHLEQLKTLMDRYNIHYTRKTVSKRSGKLAVVLELSAARKKLQQFNDELMGLDYIDEFHYNS